MENFMDMNSMKSTLHIGDTGEYLYEYAFEWSGTSRLIDRDNFNEFGAGNYHTSLSDLGPVKIMQLALDADEVIYLQPDVWSSENMRLKTQTLINSISHRKKVVNWVRTPPVQQVEYPSEKVLEAQYPKISWAQHSPKLWVFGCEFSHGHGLPEIEKQCYADILADKLNRKLIKVTRPGTSTRWSLMHLINADIGPQDIVIWQPTALGRLTVSDPEVKRQYLGDVSPEYFATYQDILTEHDAVETHLKDLPREYLRVYTDQQLLCDHLNLINIGTRYCESNNIKFMITSIDRDQNDAVRNYLSLYPQWLWTTGDFMDPGLVPDTAGPFTHAKLAQDLMAHAEFLGYI